MKWVSHRDYQATVRALVARIDALEAQSIIYRDALEAIEYINFRTIEIVPEAEARHKPEFNVQGNVIITDFRNKD